MTETVTLPTARSCPFDPPDALGQLRDEAPVRPLDLPGGNRGWLVSGYWEARAVLAHSGFRPPPEHTRYRRLLTGEFTVRRMSRLTPRIERITQECLDLMEKADRPVDLVRAFAVPVPALVIGELLGVPGEDRDQFQRDAGAMINPDHSPSQVTAAANRLSQYLAQLCAIKRAKLGDDLISGLLADGELDDQGLVSVCLLLLSAGHETTASMLALGTYALLSHPDQLAALRADPLLIDTAVEELLRYLTIVDAGPNRVATQDIEIAGQRVRAGDTVVLSFSAANRDPDRFADPDSLDLHRDTSGHMAFGHGLHQCLGRSLARVEMGVAFPMLLERFPGLRLAAAPEQIPMRDRTTVYGVRCLPVTW